MKGSISRSDIDCRVSRSLTAQHRPSVFVFYFHFIFLPIFFCLFYFVCCPRPHPPSNPLEPEAETDQSASRERTGRRVGSIFLLISFGFVLLFSVDDGERSNSIFFYDIWVGRPLLPGPHRIDYRVFLFLSCFFFCISIYIFSFLRTGFRLSIGGFYRVFKRVLLGFLGSRLVFLGRTGFYLVLLGFTRFYWVSLGFNGFHWGFL